MGGKVEEFMLLAESTKIASFDKPIDIICLYALSCNYEVSRACMELCFFLKILFLFLLCI